LRDEKGYRIVSVQCTTCGCVAEKHLDNLRAGKSARCISCASESRRRIPIEFLWLERRYQAAKHRCNNSNDPSYNNYGGRGIEFRFKSFEEYFTHVTALPDANATKELDRINNDGHYEPGNLRWVDRKEQSRNRRPNKYVTWQGTQMVWSDFVRNHTNISVTKANVLLREGKTLEEIASYNPRNVGRRAQSLRLGKLRATT
jgi:hypothetical protein